MGVKYQTSIQQRVVLRSLCIIPHVWAVKNEKNQEM